jgi:hypothetical protein
MSATEVCEAAVPRDHRGRHASDSLDLAVAAAGLAQLLDA